jgi:hypothetical protein
LKSRAARNDPWDQLEYTYEDIAGPDIVSVCQGAFADGAGPSPAPPREEGRSKGAAAPAQGERANEAGTFVLTPMVEDAVVYAVQELAGGMKLPWLDRGELTEELIASVLEGLKNIRKGVTTRPLRMERGTSEGTGDDGPQQPPPSPTGPRDGPQQPPPPPGGSREGPQSEPQGEEESQPPPAGSEGPPTEQQGAPAGQEKPPAEGDPTVGPSLWATNDVRHVCGDAGRVPRRGRGCDTPVGDGRAKFTG